MTARDEAKYLQVDWALREQLGHEVPPDLTAGVLERLRQDTPAPLEPGLPVARARGNRLWLAAAIVVLGVGAVLGAALWSRPPEGHDNLPAQQPAGPPAKPVRIEGAADVAKLPADARAVEAHSVGDDVIAALAARASRGELPQLESLTVVNEAHQTYGMGLKMQLPTNEASITAACVKDLAALSKLRRLSLSGTFALRKGLQPGTPLLGDLVRLPLLQDLTVRFVDTSAADLAVLPQLPALRELDLSFNHGFGSEGVDAIVQCAGLRSLSLRGCQQLTGAMLARLAALPQLEHLDLGLLDGINWRNVPGEANYLDEAEREVLRRAVERVAVRDEMVPAIRRLQILRWLDLSSGIFSNGGLTGFAGLARLEYLDVAGVPLRDDFPDELPTGLRELHVCCDVTDAFCRAIRWRLKELRHVDLSACSKITDIGVYHLLTLKLRVLELRQCRGITAACVDALALGSWIEELDLRHLDWVTAAHVQQLRKGMPSLRVLHTDVEDSEAAVIQRRLEEVRLEHSFASATVKEWAAYYQNIAGVTFVVTPEVRDMDPARTTLTAFKLPVMSVAQALHVIQAQTGVGWQVKDGMVLLVGRPVK